MSTLGVSWECTSCTLLNADSSNEVCDLCGAPKPKEDEASAGASKGNTSTGASSSQGAAAASSSSSTGGATSPSAAATARISSRIAHAMADDKRLSTLTDGSHMSIGAILRAGPEAFHRELEEKRKLDKVGQVKGVFGIPLVSPCPQVLCDCIAYILQFGMATEGIFRIPGQQDVVDFLRAEYEKASPEGRDLLTEHKGKFEVHDIATLFKTYFRQLPEPLIPLTHYDALMYSVRVKHDTKEDLVQAVSDVAHSIPSPERECFGFIISFLKKLAANSEVNKMNPANLATCFAPSLIRAPPNIQPQQALMDMSSAIAALNILIQNPEELPQPDPMQIAKSTKYKPAFAPPPGSVGLPPGLAIGPPPGL